MRKKVDYSAIRGFNYTQSNVKNDYEFWKYYDHDIVNWEMGYAQKLNLNSARIFLSYQAYSEDKEAVLSHIKDFVQTAWRHDISVNPILFSGFHFVREAQDKSLFLKRNPHGPLIWSMSLFFMT